MNSNAVKTIPTENNSWNCKPNKKSKRKRRRNKHKLYNLRLKKHKRKSSFKSSLDLNHRSIMSNWYWSNYTKAVEWKDKHELAHWKSCALALQEENKYLLQVINQMSPGRSPNVSVTWKNLHKRGRQSFSSATSSVDSFIDTNYKEDEEEPASGNNGADVDDGDDDVEFEMSEEMIQFFKESIKHKENLKKLKEEELAKKIEEEVKGLQKNKLKRSSEMEQLYGEGASMITGMETAIQLSYEKFCETKSPKYWPNIPFRL